jgi:hypothetical protein
MANDKFKALVHHVVSSCDDPTRLGAIRLNKILWYADTLSYRLHGTSITGEEYVKRQFGPVPKHIVATLKSLEEDGSIVVAERENALGHKLRLFFSLQDAQTELFSPAELSIVEVIIDSICKNHTAESISNLTHDQVWEAANMGEVIPLYATLASSPGEITEEALAWADNVLERIAA